MNQIPEYHKRKAGRPFGVVTLYPGISTLARQLGLSQTHVRRVLTGDPCTPELRAAILASGHPLAKHLQD